MRCYFAMELYEMEFLCFHGWFCCTQGKYCYPVIIEMMLQRFTSQYCNQRRVRRLEEPNSDLMNGAQGAQKLFMSSHFFHFPLKVYYYFPGVVQPVFNTSLSTPPIFFNFEFGSSQVSSKFALFIN